MKKILFITGLMASVLCAKGNIAITMKSIGTVSVKRDTAAAVPLKTGKALVDQDLIQTGDNGFASLVYLDDRTIIKIRSNTELKIGGTKQENGLSKNLDIMHGKLKVNVSDQKGKEFKVSTPTSVASVKGTEFFISSSQSGDSFTVLEGVVSVENTSTGQTVEVAQGQAVESIPDAPMEVVAATEEVLAEAAEEEEAIEVEFGPNEIRIEFEDEDGNIKTTIIEYE